MERNGFFIKTDTGSWWKPVGFEGGERYSEEEGSENWGKVTAQKRAFGASSVCWKSYPSFESARSAAQRLIKNLATVDAGDCPSFNAIIDRWYGR